MKHVGRPFGVDDASLLYRTGNDWAVLDPLVPFLEDAFRYVLRWQPTRERRRRARPGKQLAAVRLSAGSGDDLAP